MPARIPATALTAALAIGLVLVAPPAASELEAEPIGTVLTLPEPGSHWVWVGDFLFRRAALLDAKTGDFLGMLSSGLGVISPLFSPDRREIYLPETYYTRGSRGERVDVITVYDAATLSPSGEIPIPPKRADVVHGMALATLLDGGRFLAVHNFTPASSVTLVDVRERRFLREIATAGCALVYAAGERRFAMLCGDGSMLVVEIDASGREVRRIVTDPFFDPHTDPVTEKAVRHGDIWLFVSFEGIVHPVDLGGEMPAVGDTWSLLDEDDRRARWRIGGSQHLAIHAESGRLFALVHQGGPDGHKEPGREVWVYDLARQERVARIGVPNLMAAFLGQQMDLRDGVVTWLLERVVPSPGADSIAVTPGDEPLLLMVSRAAGTVSVHDADTGARLRHLENVGLAPGALLAPGR
jgi:methylamine dehydrogenase heavy chain